VRITAIEFAGTPKKTTRDGQGLARAFARVERKPGSEYAEITFLLPDRTSKRLVAAKADDAERRDAAADLQRTLEGCEGTNSMVHDYKCQLDWLLD